MIHRPERVGKHLQDRAQTGRDKESRRETLVKRPGRFTVNLTKAAGL